MIWSKGVLAAVGLTLVPFGSVTELLKRTNPWHGFEAQDPILIVVRAQKIPSGSCKSWMQTWKAHLPGTDLNSKTKTAADITEKLWKAWSPWDGDDHDAVQDCDYFPCDVKLNEPEVKTLAAIEEKGRMNQYLGVVARRVVNYYKTEERNEYEFPGRPVEPWALLKKKGFLTSLKMPTESHLVMRRLDFESDQVRPIRQVLDRRVTENASSRELVIWIRDVYTDHYFDSWGEWIQISCEKDEGGPVSVIQALALELDLLKKNDLISKLMRGKMRDGIKEQGTLYLDRKFNQVKALVEKSGLPPTTKAPPKVNQSLPSS